MGHFNAVDYLRVANLRIRLRSCLRAAFSIWTRGHTSKRRAVHTLFYAIRAMVLEQARTLLADWHVQAQRRTAIVHFVRWAQRRLQRCCAHALGTWQHWTTTTHNDGLAIKQQEAEARLAILRQASE